MYSTVGQYAAVIIIWLTLFVSPGAAYGNPDFFPEPNPPWGERDAEMVGRHPTGSRALAPTVEWKLHKTADSRHPMPAAMHCRLPSQAHMKSPFPEEDAP